MQYFDHDTTAGGDDKIIALRLDQGGAAVDAYWVILEQIYRDETALDFFGNQHITRSVCHRLATDSETLKTWILAMLEIGLLERTEENPNAIHSPRASKNIESYKLKAETARQNGKKGGRKPKKKPSENQSENQKQTYAETEEKANKRKEKKGIGTHKEYLIPLASAGASAAKAAPPPQGKPFCPECGEKAWKNPQTGKYDCDGCRGHFSVSEVVFR